MITSRTLVVAICVICSILISLINIRTTINSLTIELMNDQGRSLRIYYDTGSGYNELESAEGEVLRRDKHTTTYHFPIPNDRPIISVRVDLDEQPAQYLINKISLNYLFNSKRLYPLLTWDAGQIERLFLPLHNVKPFHLRQDYLLVETEGPDPYFGIKENLSEMWEDIRNQPHPLLLPVKISGYILLALLAGLFRFHRYVSVWLTKLDHLFSRMVILGLVILFLMSAYFMLDGGGMSVFAYNLFFYWIYLTGVFFFAGWIMQRLLNFVCPDLFKNIDLSQCIILGVVSLTIAVILLHFLLPLNSTIHIVVILSLCIFCVIDHKRISNYCIEKLNRAGIVHQCFSSAHILLTVIIFTGFIFVALRIVYLSIGGPTEYDTLLYHAQIVRWIKEYPIVPGLGNLHGRLAYNSSFHILASFLDVGFFQDKSFHGLNGFFYLFLQANLLIRLWFLCRGNVSILNIFASLFILLEPLLIEDFFIAKVNSFSTDILTFILTGYIILYFIQLLEDKHHAAKGGLILGSAIAGFAATVKLVSTPLLLLTIFVLISYMKTTRLKKIINGDKRYYLILYLMILILFAPWVIRSVVLSGYPIYPLYQVDLFNPDWKVPKKQVIDEARWIQSWARIPNIHPDQVLDQGFLHWFKHWNKRSVIPLGLILGLHLGILLIFFLYYKKIILLTWPIYVALSSTLLYWFFSAPDPRFAYGILYASSVFLVSIIIYVPLRAISETKIILPHITAVILMLMILTAFDRSPNDKSYIFQNLVDMPALPTIEYVTKGGLKIRIPIQGDKVGNAELPSTPYPHDNIVLRKNKFAEGFRTLSQ